MKICHIVDSFSVLTETFIYDHVLELDKQGFSNEVITRRRVDEADRPYGNVRIIRPVSQFSATHLASKALWYLDKNSIRRSQRLFAQSVKRAIGLAKPDIVQAHFGPAAFLALPAIKKYGVPMVVTFHGYDATSLPNSPLWRAALQEALKHSAVAVGVSDHLCGKIVALGMPPEKVRRIHYGVRRESFAFEPAPFQAGKPTRFLFVGRLVEKKNPEAVLRSFKICSDALSKTSERAELSIIGEGPLMSACRALAGELNLNSQVTFMGALPRSRVAQSMRESDIYVQHSVTAADGDQEGLPLGILEAMASGLPVVSTRHSGIPEMVKEGLSGCLVDEGDVLGMAEHLRRLALDPELRRRLGGAGRASVQNYFYIERQVREYADCYRSLK